MGASEPGRRLVVPFDEGPRGPRSVHEELTLVGDTGRGNGGGHQRGVDPRRRRLPLRFSGGSSGSAAGLFPRPALGFGRAQRAYQTNQYETANKAMKSHRKVV